MDVSKEAVFISITKFHIKLNALAHKFEWSTGLCKTCYPNDIDLCVYTIYGISVRQRCLIPCGTINFTRLDSYAKETGIYINKGQLYRVFRNWRDEFNLEFGHDIRRCSN